MKLSFITKLVYDVDKSLVPGVKPCYSITSHKAQGQTLSKVGIYMKDDFFGHGQLYVAMSRVGSFKDLKIFKPSSTEKKSIDAKYMKNVVYKTILK